MRTFAAALLIATAVLARGNPGLRAQQTEPCGPAPACKVCVSEPKPTTRKVYAYKVEEYCLPRCRLLTWLCGAWGGDSGPCGDLKVRHRLVVKTVPGCDTRQCVPREPTAAQTTSSKPTNP
jgi:hypothetical protein